MGIPSFHTNTHTEIVSTFMGICALSTVIPLIGYIRHTSQFLKTMSIEMVVFLLQHTHYWKHNSYFRNIFLKELISVEKEFFTPCKMATFHQEINTSWTVLTKDNHRNLNKSSKTVAEVSNT